MIAAALGRVPSGLFIVTYLAGEAEIAFLGSWVQQCSFEPPMLSVAINKGRGASEWLFERAPFAISILAEGQKDLLAHFGKGRRLAELPDVDDRIIRTAGHAPALKEAVAVLHCRMTGRATPGDHHLFFGEIIAGALQSDATPYVHIRKNGLNY